MKLGHYFIILSGAGQAVKSNFCRKTLLRNYLDMAIIYNYTAGQFSRWFSAKIV